MQALIALGGNMNFGGLSPEGVMTSALHAIAQAGLTVTRQSRLYATPAFPAGSGADYVNAALRLDLATPHTPESLYRVLAGIEQAHDRQRLRRWGARTLDIDILGIEGVIHPDLATFRAWADLPPASQARRTPSGIILPHPRLHERAFVLVPLMDIAPDWLHPVYGKTVAQMLASLPPTETAAVTPISAKTPGAWPDGPSPGSGP